MTRPSFQFYPGDWQANSNLRRCTHDEKGLWIDVICLLHDQDEYGIARWTAKEIARAVNSTPKKLQKLIEKRILKGGDKFLKMPFIYTPRSGRKSGDPVTLIAEQDGPIWYSSRMVIDEHKRSISGGSTRFQPRGEGKADTLESSNPSPNPSPSRRLGEGQGDGSSSSSSSSSSSKEESGNKFSDTDLELAGVIFDGVLIAAPKTKPPNLDSWADTIRLMRERDGHTHEEIEQVFLFANNNDFWKTNILSVSKLREKFATLHAQMINAQEKQQPQESQIRRAVI